MSCYRLLVQFFNSLGLFIGMEVGVGGVHKRLVVAYRAVETDLYAR